MGNTFVQEISPLQIQTTKNLKGIVDSNHTIQHFSGKPHALDQVLSYALNYDATGKFNGNYLLEFLTTALGNTEIQVGNDEIVWDIVTTCERNYTISRTNPSGTTMRGQGGSAFDLYFKTKCFSKGDVIMSEKQYHLRLQDDMVQTGYGWKASVQLLDPTQESIPADQLLEGVRYARLYTLVEEYSDYGGSPEWSTPATLRTQLSTIRLQQPVTGKAVTNDITKINLYNPNTGKYDISTWMQAVDIKTLYQMKRDTERLYNYGIASHVTGSVPHINGPNGRPVLSGAGLRQQISPANVYTHNGYITYGFLSNLLIELSQIRGDGTGMEFMCLTGFGGQEMINKMVRDEMTVQGVTFQNDYMHFYSMGQDKTLTFTEPLFQTINFKNGIKLTVMLNPIQNDKNLFTQKHPKTGLPVESYRMTILPKYTKDGGPNLVSVVKKMRKELIWYVEGSMGPTAVLNSSGKRSAASSIDGYEINALSDRGIVLKDPLSAAEINPNFNI